MKFKVDILLNIPQIIGVVLFEQHRYNYTKTREEIEQCDDNNKERKGRWILPEMVIKYWAE